jgi:hypothetical protein
VEGDANDTSVRMQMLMSRKAMALMVIASFLMRRMPH